MSFVVGLVLACGTPEPDRYPVTGQVVEIRSAHEVVIAHDDIEGFMAAMTMPFTVSDPKLLNGVHQGDRVSGTLVLRDLPELEALTVTERAPAPVAPRPADRQAIAIGAAFPTTPVALADGPPVVIGTGQEGRFAVTFLYTRCPLPNYCPLVVSRLQALQPRLPEGARLLAITLDPEHDTDTVLAEFAAQSGAIPGTWDFGRVPPEVLVGLAEKAGLDVHGKGLGITHDLVLLVLDDQGQLIARYRDMAWDADAVLAQLGAS